ncbi:hypothetical protein [Amycolatopsis ultiminotia]|uniref:hypothetical protein n=1 Tax=Amycolatopsis ultiminotia TaxID=543629 RepID=UPI0031E941E6
MLFDQRGRVHTSASTAGGDDALIEFVRICSHYYAHHGRLGEEELLGKHAGIPACLPRPSPHGRAAPQSSGSVRSWSR